MLDAVLHTQAISVGTNLAAVLGGVPVRTLARFMVGSRAQLRVVLRLLVLLLLMGVERLGLIFLLGV